MSAWAMPKATGAALAYLVPGPRLLSSGIGILLITRLAQVVGSACHATTRGWGLLGPWLGGFSGRTLQSENRKF